jgi:N utilization substance protein A
MIKIKFDLNLIKTISLFQKVTNANIKDCLEQNGKLIFVVNKGDMAKAIGPHGANVHRLENMFKKKIKIIEYSEDLVEFVGNVVAPIRPAGIVEEEGTVIITPEDMQSRGLLIGRSAVNLRAFEEIVKRFFPNVKVLKVVG